MDEILTRFFGDLAGRVGGPLSFRLILQPAVAIYLAIRAGVLDAHNGRPPYFWTILSDRADRSELLSEGWKAVAKVFVLAVLIDVVYQLWVYRWWYPVESLVVAFVLACLPYLLVRGLANRIARARQHVHLR
jgi:hypothetical protein